MEESLKIRLSRISMRRKGVNTIVKRKKIKKLRQIILIKRREMIMIDKL
jgi:hypothetical protein